MTQVNRVHQTGNELASRKRASGRTLAQRRADFEAQARRHLGIDEFMAVSDLSQVSARLKELRQRLARRRGRRVPQYEVARELGNIPPRTFQSWENGEVETEGDNYQLIADYYARELDEPITRNWILFGQDEEPDLPALSAGSDEDRLTAIEARLDALEDTVNEIAKEVGVDVVTREISDVGDAAGQLGVRERRSQPVGARTRSPEAS